MMMRRIKDVLTWCIKLMPLVFPLYFLDFQVYGVPFTATEVLVYIVFVGFVLSGMLPRKILRDKIAILVALFFFAAVVSTIIVPATFYDITGVFVDSQRIALGVLKGWVFMPLLYFLMALSVIRGDKDRKHMIIAFAWSAIWLSVWGLLSWTEDFRASAFYESANYLALYLGPVCVFFGIGLLESIKSKLLSQNALFLLPGILVFAAMFATKSYAGVIAVAAGIFFYLMLSKNFTRKFKFAFAGFVILLCSFFALSQISTEKGKEFLEFDDRSSSSARIQIWHASYEMITQSPLFGVGLGQYQLNYQWKMTYLYDLDTYEWLIPHPHNFLMGIWLNFGLLGVITMLGIVVLAFSRTKGHMKLVLASMLFSVIVHGLFDMPFMKNDLAMEFWLIIALLL